MKTKVVFYGYRDWAKSIIEVVSKHHKIETIDKIFSQDEYLSKVDNFDNNIDIMLFIGWSWIIPTEVTKKFLCLGIHPSDLPNYRGGSPLQHQIINGLNESKVSLMTLSSEKLDAGDIWMKGDFDITGNNMDIIFGKLVNSSVEMLNVFFDTFPNIEPETQNVSLGSYFKRRKPSDSKITIEQMQSLSLENIYNIIRSLTDPYPNAYLEDNEGNKLLFKEVVYINSNKTKHD